MRNVYFELTREFNADAHPRMLGLAEEWLPAHPLAEEDALEAPQ